MKNRFRQNQIPENSNSTTWNFLNWEDKTVLSELNNSIQSSQYGIASAMSHINTLQFWIKIEPSYLLIHNLCIFRLAHAFF
jgi:hypothetical protein